MTTRVRSCRPYAAHMLEIGSRARKLPAPPAVVWDSLVRPRQPGTREWLDLLADETEPHVLDAERPGRLVWSSLWPSRPRDEVHFELTPVGSETLLRFTLLTPDDLPDDSNVGHLRRRLNQLLFGDLRLSYGQ
jgi:hypothetical protein